MGKAHDEWARSKQQTGWLALKQWEHQQRQQAMASSPQYTEGVGYKRSEVPNFPRKIGLMDDASQYWGQHGLVGGLTPRGLMGSQPQPQPQPQTSASDILVDGFASLEGTADHTDKLGIETTAWGMVDDKKKNPASTIRNNAKAKAMFGKTLSQLTNLEKKSVAKGILQDLDNGLSSKFQQYQQLDPQHRALVLDAKWNTGTDYVRLMNASLNHQYNPDAENTAEISRESRRMSGGSYDKGMDNRIIKLFNHVGLKVDASELPENSMQPVQKELKLGSPTGYMTDEGFGRRAYHNNFGGMSTEYTIGVENPGINGGQLTHIPSIYDGQIVDQPTAEKYVIEAGGKDRETGRLITPGGDPEARSKNIKLKKQIAYKPRGIINTPASQGLINSK